MKVMTQRLDLGEGLKKLARQHWFWAWRILAALIASWVVWDLIDTIVGTPTP